MMRSRWLLLSGAVFGLSLVVVTARSALQGMTVGGKVPVFEVRRGAFIRKVTAEGNLEAVKATPLVAPMEAEGPLKIAWIVPDGSRVKADDIVVRFDPTDMERMLRDGQAEQRTAQSKIQGKTAVADGVIHNLDRDAEMARTELEYSSRFQSKDPEVFSRTQIIESEIDQRLAAERVANAEAVREIQEKLTKVDIDLLAIDRTKAELRIGQARKGLHALEVRAPHDGIVVLKRQWRGVPKVGDSAWSGMPLAEIPQLDVMEAVVFVLEADAGGLAVGRPATVVLEARLDRAYNAKVKKVAALAKPRVGWIPVQYFEVTLDLERTDPEIMKPGQRVRATLVLEEKQDVFSVPRAAVIEMEGKKVVYRRKGWGFEPVDVTLGPSALGNVVVLTGIEDGDVLALRDPTRPSGESSPQEGPGPAVPTRSAARGAP